MKTVIMRTNLKDGFDVVQRATSETGNLPILKNVLIDCKKAGVVVSATNLEIALRCTVPAKVVGEGSVTVPGALFSQLLQTLSSERIELESKGDNLHVQTDLYEGTILGSSSEDFPIIPSVDESRGFIQIEGELFKEALQSVVVATQATDVHPELYSVLFDFTLDSLLFVATDSFRLSQYQLHSNQFKTTISDAFRALVPAKTIQTLLGFVADGDLVTIYFDANQVLFKTSSVECVSRLMQGQFPAYEQILPREYRISSFIDPKELINAIKLVSVLGGKSSEVTLTFLPVKKSLEISARSDVFGENRVLIPARMSDIPPSSKEEEAINVSFNSRYVSDGLKIFKGKEIFLGISDENRPTKIAQQKDGSWFYIVMPTVKT